MRCPRDEVERLDEELVSLARVEGALRLRLGQVLEALSRGACFELGFSSLSAHALERCGRSVRWVEAARCLARRAEELPELRRALAFGKVSWSMGELLARVAQAEDEAGWMRAAENRTVRQVRALVSQAMARARQADGGVAPLQAQRREAPGGEGRADGRDGRDDAGVDGVDDGRDGGDGCCGRGFADGGSNDGGFADFADLDERCTLKQAVDQEDAWLFEATRTLLDQLGVHGTDAQCEALLAEAQTTLLAALPKGTFDDPALDWQEGAQQRWLRELARRREHEEALCEKRLRESLLEGRRAGVDADPVALAAARGLVTLVGLGATELDDQARDLARALSRHDLDQSRALLRFHRLDGWRRLGYASETQYARERLGMSSSSSFAKRALAARLEKLPRVAAALGKAQMGIEAAVQVVRVATPLTEAAWVDRARRRTVKHLREEVAAALVAVRLSGEVDCPPPEDTELDAFHELERAVVSGRALKGRRDAAAGEGSAGGGAPAGDAPERRAWLEMLGSLARWLDGGLRTSAGGARPRSSAGRVVLRLGMSRATYAWWRGLEARARPWLPAGVSWLRLLCLSMWQAWQHLLGVEVAYGRIYIRDRFRCLSPVCSRRDVTPHHLRFRSAGGGDEDDNVATVCSWCHLLGVHGGRIRAVGTARHIRWELGQPGSPCLIVQGRERLAA